MIDFSLFMKCPSGPFTNMLCTFCPFCIIYTLTYLSTSTHYFGTFATNVDCDKKEISITFSRISAKLG